MDMTALFDLSYGVYVVGALDGNRSVGCVANSAMQITAEPMTMAVSLNKKNFTEDAVRKCGYFTISVLSQDTESTTIGKFGFQSSAEMNKYDDENWKRVGDAGIPVLDNESCSWILCKVIKEIDVLAESTQLLLIDVYGNSMKYEITNSNMQYYNNDSKKLF